MNNLGKLLIITTILFSCAEDENDCQTCTKTIGGVAGNFVDEIREVCNESDVIALEESSSGTTVWTCE
jgi:hypothetical protein